METVQQQRVQEAANQFARLGYDKDAIVVALHKDFPDAQELSLSIAALGSLRMLEDAAIPVAAPPPPPAAAAPERPQRPTRSKYNWSVMPNGVLPAEARQTRTLLPATIGSMPSIFNGEANSVHTLSWGTVRVQGHLTPFDLRVHVAICEEIQANEGRCANGSLTAESSFRKIYSRINNGKYGGSGMCRIKRALERLCRAVIQVDDVKNNEKYRFRVVESYETIAAASGRRLVVRLGQTLTDRFYAKGGVQGRKPLDLEPWRQLRGRDAVAYLMFTSRTATHSIAELSLDNCAKHFNLKGSLPHQTERLKQLVAALDGRSCAPCEADGKKAEQFSSAHLVAELLPGKVRVRRVQIPAG
jgi:hypothetical protein